MLCSSIKNGSIFMFMLLWSFSTLQAMKQDSLGLPGDDFDLYAALELFKKSNSPEEFEKSLNSEENHINNLDLNGDNQIDYIRVSDYASGNAHSIVLQAVLSDTEMQDVAVIEMEEKAKMVHLQIVGDEDLYGKDYIIEPIEDNTLPNAPIMNDNAPPVVVNVYAWPAVQYLYTPGYRVWISPYHWSIRPPWWRPWRPMYWHAYYRIVRPYHNYYRPVQIHRTMIARGIYAPNRTRATVIRQNNSAHYVPRNGNIMGSTRRMSKIGQQSNVQRDQRVRNNNAGQRSNRVRAGRGGGGGRGRR